MLFRSNGTMRLVCDKDRNGTIEVDATLDIEVECDEDGGIILKPGKWSNLSEDIKQSVGDAKTQAQIANLLKQRGPLSPSKIGDVLGISVNSVKQALLRGKNRKRGSRFAPVGNGTWKIQDD